MTANDYPGNAALPEEVRQRVLSTFRQTIDLYREGKLEEVIVGCDLILEMDDRFRPAHDLRDKALDPSLPIDPENLLAPTAPAAATNSDAEILSAIEALNRRDFQAAIDICNSVLAVDPGNAEAQKLGAKAFERLEAAPFVEQFIEQGRGQLAAGNVAEARQSFEKAKALDPLHPALKELEDGLSAPSTPQASYDVGGEAPTDFASAFSAPSTGGFSLDGDGSQAPPAGADAPADSFVVETGGTGADSPAADYGFTFEEEPAGSRPPEASAPPEPTVGEAHTFDFSSAAVEISGEDQEKVASLLREGDEAMARGEVQEAIDIWSRIFLIDVTNEVASTKIEKAKELRQEAEMQADSSLQLALQEYANKDYQSARKHFEEVLAADPNNPAALEHIEKLADLEAAMQVEAKTGAAPITAPPSAPPAADLFEDDFLSDAGMAPPLEPPSEPPPPPPAAAAKSEAPKARPAPEKKVRVPMAAVIAVVAIILGVGGWFGYKSFFGGSKASVAETQAILKQAESLADQGKFQDATKLLLSVGPDDPLRDRALEMIADVKNRQKNAAGTVGGRPAAAVFNEYLAKGKEAYLANDFAAARDAFEQAAAIQPLPPEFREMYDDSTQRMGKLANATNLFREGHYNEAIRSIESILQTDPDNANAIQMLADAHFDLGATALRDGRLKDAETEFSKVLELRPNDEMAQRSRDFAQRYDGEAQDLLYRIYVKYLPLR